MLNSVLIVGVPLVALLAAALYIFSKSQPTAHGPQGSRQSSFFGAAHSSSQTQSASTVRKRSGKKREQSHDQDGNQSPTSDSPDSGFTEEEHCEICFEDAAKVQLYPCKHSDICETCVNKLLVTNRRECPFCRRRIDGYIDMESGHQFG